MHPLDAQPCCHRMATKLDNQRLIGGTGSAVVLAIAFVLLALCAVL